MSKSDPTLWQADPHTIAKHNILRAYLNRWMPIVTRTFASRYRYVWYIDGFSGPGEYKKGELGSPLVALDAAMNHGHQFPIPVRMTFIEERQDRVDHLRKLLDARKATIASAKNVLIESPIQGDCPTVLRNEFAQLKRVPPTLAFLDQFGYSDVPMELIATIMSNQSCEVFSYLDFNRLNHTLSDPAKEAAVTKALASSDWKQAINLNGADRETFLRDTYKRALHEKGKAEYVTHFSMHGKDGRLLYWLFFCSGNDRGLEEMKEAMWDVAPSGDFIFSDKHAGQPLLLKQFTQDWLADVLAADLAGKTMSVEEVRLYVLTETPCVKYKEALKLLELSPDSKITAINPSPKRRRGTFAEPKMKIRFKDVSLFGP